MRFLKKVDGNLTSKFPWPYAQVTFNWTRNYELFRFILGFYS